MKYKIKTIEEILDIVNRIRDSRKSFVLTNGCFDIIHLDHIIYLRKARKLADYLIVALNSDKSIRELKGSTRPLKDELARAEILAEFESVDYLFLFYDKTMERIIKLIKPDIYVKGGDYTLETINQNERRLIESYGGKISILPGITNLSTSQLLGRMRGKKDLERKDLES